MDWIFILIYSFHSLSYDWSIASSKVSSKRMRSNASSFNFQHPLVSLRSTSSCLRLLPHHPVTSISPSIFTSITCFSRQFQRKMWPNQLAFLLCIVCTIFLSSLTLQYFFISHMIGPTDLFHPSPAPHFRPFQVFLIYLNEVSNFYCCTVHFDTCRSHSPTNALFYLKKKTH